MPTPSRLQPPRPLRVAEEVPASAVGREPLFFFGTLMDHEILSHLLQRPVSPASLEPARLPGFRRIRAHNADYPLLVPAPEGAVEGRLFRAYGEEDLRRINHYECDEYHAELHEVLRPCGESVPAWVYRGREAVLLKGREPWDLESWARIHKASFFARIDEWMADFTGS